MKQMFLFFAVCVLMLSFFASAQVPQKISYQGLLTGSSGSPVQDGSYNLKFEIYNLPSGGLLRYTQTSSGVSVSKGTFSVILGPLPAIFSESLYVEVTALAGSPGISSDITFSPRSELTSAPYALHSILSDTAEYARATAPGGSYLPLAGGTMTGAITSTGNPAITMGKGNFGSGNVNTGTQAFVAGSNNRARGDYSVVGGGGGADAGADSNSAKGIASTISGGSHNRANSDYATAGGGTINTASGSAATVAGGYMNTSSGNYATVGGGSTNGAIGPVATVSGGSGNTASGDNATVGGGGNNNASGGNATIGGGGSNTASGALATVGGGGDNTASAYSATIGGGLRNRARGQYSVVGGGGGATTADSNSAIGDYSMIPGGRTNKAGGNYSFAAGRRAKANDAGTFVWADQTDADFASTADNQFLIRAGGGVGIGTSSPNEQLEITGNFRLPTTTASTGIIKADGDRFIYNYHGDTYIGINAGNLTSNGYANTAIGAMALMNNVNANYSVAVGTSALKNSYNGFTNVAVGVDAQFSNSSGYDNVSVGGATLYTNVNGSTNTAIGGAAGRNNEGDGNVFIGFKAGFNETASNNKLFIANTDTKTLIYGDFSTDKVGINTTAPQGALDVSSTTGAFIVPRMTTVQRNALTAVNGMIIYNTTTNQFNFYEAGAWVTK